MTTAILNPSKSPSGHEPADGPLAQARKYSELFQRSEIDLSCRYPVLAFFVSGVFWLLVGSILAMLASIKMHNPHFLSDWSWLTFGRVRPAHLSTVAFGWGAMTGLGTLIWLMCRLCRTPLRFPAMLVIAAGTWNIGMICGTACLLTGYTTGIEWIEFPLWVGFILFVSFALVGIWAMYTFGARHAGHVYVSQWYLFGAIFWFPWLYATVYILEYLVPVKGVSQETIHWWFGHNALGVFFTPIGLATIYYLIPKVIGKPIYSYYLSILGFWSLALFYNWAGAHHIIGGPVPAWLVTVSIVGSMMMFIPVTTTAINHHMTTYKNFGVLRYSPTLRFTVFGAMSYTVVSVQGSLMSLKVYNEPFHFTHHTIAHAHLGLYGFYTMVLFGALYYIVPRLTAREWASSRTIRFHFWSCAIGILIYFVLLSIGGMIQGFEMNQAGDSLFKLMHSHGWWTGTKLFVEGFKYKNGAVPFIEIVENTRPWLISRSIGGGLMALGHFAFAGLFLVNLLGIGPKRQGPTLLRSDEEGYRKALQGDEGTEHDEPSEGNMARA